MVSPMKHTIPFLLIWIPLAGCSENTGEHRAAKNESTRTDTRSDSSQYQPRRKAVEQVESTGESTTLIMGQDEWVGVYSSPAEIGGFSGTVLVIEESIVGSELRYRKSFYSDVRSPDDIEQEIRTGNCLIDGNRIFIPQAYGYLRGGKPQLLASIERLTRASINGRIVLLRDDARVAFEAENKLYDYGILIKVADKPHLLLDLAEVKHESIKLLQNDKSKAWQDPFTNGPNER
jgi:hypothetical protein